MPDEAPYLGQHCVTPYPRSEIIRRILWSLVQATFFRWSPRSCHAWRAHLLRWFGADIPTPSQVVIFPTVNVTFPWKLRLEPRSMLGRRVVVYNLALITLERGANVSQNTHLCAGSHDFLQWSMPLVTAPIVIGRNAWIAADVFVGPGVTIGELAVIGARSVVVKSQPARMICAGHPCRPLKPRAEPA
jgi:putative colanic acid biosynthesis acetyltransferase WcaF